MLKVNQIFTSLTYRIQSSPVTLSIIGLFFCGVLLHYADQSNAAIFGIIPERNSNPIYWYTFLTYTFYHLNFVHWFNDSFFILLIGLIVEPRLNKKVIILLLTCSVILSAAILSLLSDGDVIIVGGTYIMYGYIGALLGLFRDFRSFTISEKIITFIMGILVLAALVNWILLINKTLFSSTLISFVLLQFLIIKFPHNKIINLTFARR